MAASTGGIKAGRAFVLIEAVDKTARVFGKVYANFMKLGRDLSRLGQDIMMKSMAALFPTAISLKVYKDFDDAMKKVEARSRGTGREMDVIRQQAKKLGRETAFTAAEIGNLQAILAQKGFTRSQIPKATVPIMTLARAAGEGFDAGEDAENATRLVTGALKAWRMETGKAGEVADMFTAAVNGSSFTLQELITSLQYAGPVAAEFNLSLADTLATLGMMRDLEIDPSIAGTAFRNMQLYMTSTKGQDDFNAVLQEATGNTISFVDAAGNLRPLPDLIFAIGKASEHMGSAMKMNMLGELFGVRAVVPASALQHGIEGFARLHTEITTSTGLSVKAMAKMEAGIGGAWRRFTSAAEGMALAVGEALEPALMDLEKKVSELMTSFASWTHNNSEAVIQVLMLVSASFALGVALTAVGVSLKLLAVLVLPLSIAFKSLAISMALTKAILVALWSIAKIHIVTLNVWKIALVTLNAVIAISRASLIAWNAAVWLCEFGAVGLQLALMGLKSVWLLTSGIWGYITAITVFAVLAILAVKGIMKMYDALQAFNKLSYSPMGISSQVSVLDWNQFKADYSRSAADMKAVYAQAFAEMGADFSSWSTRMAASGAQLGATLINTWQGVSTALSLGDTQAAWEIGMAGIESTWVQGVDMMMDTWNDFSLFFIETWEGTKTSFLESWTSLQTTIAGGLIGVLGGNKAVREARQAEVDRIMGLQRLKDKGLLTDEQLTGTNGSHNGMRDESMAGITGQRARLEEEKKAADEARRIASGDKLRDIRSARQKADEEREAKKAAKAAELAARLADINARAAEERKGAEDNLSQSFDDLLKSLEQRANDIIHTGITAESGIAPEIHEGLQRGSVEAAKQAWENSMRQDKKNDPVVEEMKEANATLTDISDNLRNAASLFAIA